MVDQGAGLDLAAINALIARHSDPEAKNGVATKTAFDLARVSPALVAEVERLQAIEQAAWTMVRTPTFDVLVKLKTALAAGGVS